MYIGSFELWFRYNPLILKLFLLFCFLSHKSIFLDFIDLHDLGIHSLLLEHNIWIHLDVRHVNFLAFFDDIRMFTHHQPSYVREKESTARVVWIPVRVAILVMLSMVSNPNVQTILGEQKYKYSL